eukprot:TRINITY_DN4410_c0_g1_i3.p1 TRINITY_DN4410_c0_g1~~TRINITY_DN4410_c0_g1_i3.p1  ORF type:complete len:151 (-),score=30.00 TRINITY_DN4410_c0_g1_i3:334-786(-)
MLTVTVALPKERGGLDGGVVYFDSEGGFSPERLAEMATSRFEGEVVPKEFLRKIFVFPVQTSAALLSNLCSAQFEELIVDSGVRLIVVDSVASIARREFGSSHIALRQETLSQEAARLKQLAEVFQLAVLVTNQACRAHSFFLAHPIVHR